MTDAAPGAGHRISAGLQSGLLALIAIGVYRDAQRYPPALVEGAPGPAFFPRLLAMLLLACTIMLAVRRSSSPTPAEHSSRAGKVRFVLAALLIAGFLLAWTRLGTVVTLPFLVAGLMWLAGERSRPALVAVPLAFTAFVYVGFGVALGVPLPSGIP